MESSYEHLSRKDKYKLLTKDFLDRDGDRYVRIRTTERIGWEDTLPKESAYSAMILNPKSDRELYNNAITLARQMITSMDTPFKVTVRVDPTRSCTDSHSVYVATSVFDDPALPLGQKLDTFLGLTVHEGSHLLYTDFQAMRGNNNYVIHQLQNIFEDERIERELGQKKPGLANFLKATKYYYFGRYQAGLQKDLPRSARLFNAILSIVRYPASLSPKDAYEFADELLQVRDILTPYPDSTKACIEKAALVYEILKRFIEEDKGREQQQSSSGSGSSSQSSSSSSQGSDNKEQSGKSNSSDGKDSESKEKGKGEKEDSSDSNSSSGSGKASEDEKEDDADGKNNGAGSKEQPKNSEESEDDNESDAGSDGDKEEENDEKDSRGNKGSKESDDDETEGSVDTNDTVDTDDSEDSKNDTNSESNSSSDEENDESEENDSEESDGPETESNSDNADDGNDSADEEDSGMSDTPSGNDSDTDEPGNSKQYSPAGKSGGNGAGSGTPTPSKEDADADELESELEDSLPDDNGDIDPVELSDEDIEQILQDILDAAKELSNDPKDPSDRNNPLNEDNVAKALQQEDALLAKECEGELEIGSTPGVIVIKQQGDKHRYDLSLKRVKRYIPAVRQALRAKGTEYKYTVTGMRSGLLDTNKLCEARQGVQNVYIHKGEVKCDKVNVVLVIDESGSMEGIREQLARDTAVLVNEAVGGLQNVSLFIYGYTGGYDGTGLFPYREGKPSQDRYAIGAITSRGGTPTAPAMLEAASRIRKISKEKTLMFLISDGMADSGIRSVREATNQMKKQNIDVVGISISSGLDAQTLSAMYDHYIVMDNLDNLASELGKTVKKAVLSNTKKHVA